MESQTIKELELSRMVESDLPSESSNLQGSANSPA